MFKKQIVDELYTRDNRLECLVQVQVWFVPTSPRSVRTKRD